MSEASSPQTLRTAASATLGVVMAAHILLETGRDAVFLSNVSVERLPFVTIAIALIALALSRLDGGADHRRSLLVLQLAASVGTAGLWVLVGTGRAPVYYVLYVWSGIVTSLVVVHFWLLLAELFTITEGKRVFASIAMGGSMGALVGSLVATLVAPTLGGRGLIGLAALGFAASALGPVFIRGERSNLPAVESRERLVGWRESLDALTQSPYAQRVCVIVMVGGMTLALADYLFKSVLTAAVAPDQLATWFSRIYLGLNVLSIGVLAVGVTPVVRRLGVDRALAVLPALMAIAAVGVLAGAALISTIGLKLVDGTLRYSLHKTATELLYLPMKSSLRHSVKSAIDLVGQTGAKAIGGLVILGLVALPGSTMWVALAVAVAASVWAFLALRLRRAYLDVFRDALGEGLIETMIDHPELDFESAASLIRALSDPDEARSLAALRLLAERGQSGLVPNLILYHPSPRVVEAALDVLTRERRDDIAHVLDHLIAHEDPRVRAATVRARWALEHDLETMRSYEQSDCLVVRVSAYAGLHSAGEVDDADYASVLDEALHYETSDARKAAATAALLDYHPVYRAVLVAMARDDDVEVARAALRAIRASDDPDYTEPLVGLLGSRDIREDVRCALIQRGKAALDELVRQLGRDDTPRAIKVHVPRTIARFPSAEAAARLLEGLAIVDSGIVRFKILKGLATLLDGRLREDAHEIRGAVDLSPLRDEFERTLERTSRLHDVERGLRAVQSVQSEFRTTGGELLVDLLADKRVLATQRLFMMLDLLDPHEDFVVIREGLESGGATGRSSAAELIETLLDADTAASLLDLFSEKPVRPPRKGDGLIPAYVASLASIFDDDSDSLRAVTLYHSAELEIDELVVAAARGRRHPIDRDRPGAPGGPESGIDRGLAAIRDLFDREAFARLVAVH